MNRTPASSHSPDRQHLALLRDVSFQPVFIIGDHRSGTTLLHRLLAETGCFNFVTAYHVIRYDQVLAAHLAGRTEQARQDLMKEFQSLGLTGRIIDDVPATPDSPIEYGFGLASKERRNRLTPETLPRFMELARKIQFVSSDRSRPLLLKNPWDALNFMEIRDMFPRARFVFIHRHPLLVITSQLRATRSLLAQRNPFAEMLVPFYRRLHERPLRLRAARLLDRPPFRIIERTTALHAVRIARYFLDHIGSLPASSYVSVQYEELCQDRDKTLGKITGFLRVSPRGLGLYQDEIAPRPPRVSADARRVYSGILKKLKPYLDYHGYGVEPK